MSLSCVVKSLVIQILQAGHRLESEGEGGVSRPLCHISVSVGSGTPSFIAGFFVFSIGCSSFSGFLIEGRDNFEEGSVGVFGIHVIISGFAE